MSSNTNISSTSNSRSLCKSYSTSNLTPEDIYDIMKGNHTGGIVGYNPARKYFDYEQVKWLKKREEILKRHRAHWPPMDWPIDKETGEKKPPVKTNFIDDVVKWSKSFCDLKKAEEIKENLASKGHPIIEYNKDDKKIPKVNMRKIFMEKEAEKEKLRKEREEYIPDWKQNSLEQTKEKIKQMEESLKKPKYQKPNWSKCDRLTITADSEFVGETIPFYSSNDKGKNAQPVDNKKMFYPNKEPILPRNPKWSIGPRVRVKPGEKVENQFIKARDELLQEKANKALEKSKLDPKEFIPDMLQSYDKVMRRGRLPFVFHKRFEYDKTEQYISAKNQNPDYQPGPTAYWDDGIGYSKREAQSTDDKYDRKKYLMSKDKTYKRLYVPNLRKSVF